MKLFKTKSADCSSVHTLIERIANNDPIAFKVFYNYYYKQAYQYVRLYVQDDETIEEVLSDVFVAFWQGRQKLLDVKDFDSYLFITVRNHARKHFKEKREYLRVSLDEVTESEGHASDMADSILITDEMQEAIEWAINDLPERCRAIFFLIRTEKKSYKEVAELLNISEKTVHAQMCIATKKLGHALSSYLK